MSVGVSELRDHQVYRPARIGIDGRRLGLRLKGIGRAISDRWSIRVDDSRWGRLPNNLWLVASAGVLSQRDRLDVFWGGTGLLPLVGLNIPTVLMVHDVVHRVARRPWILVHPGRRVCSLRVV